MNRSRRYIKAFLRTAVALLFLPALLTRCASMMTPTGGPRDTLPPVIVRMLPDNFSTNRSTTHHEKIYIEFDEFVQIKDKQKEFYTSPQTKKSPMITLRGRGVVIQLRDTLLENTTYSLNFGSSIRDNNEDNPLNSMRYVFSTGPEIDSMVVSGYTADGYKADSVSKSFIWFYPADSLESVAEYDSILLKPKTYKPSSIARAETNGIFIAQNLKPIKYRIYAIQDKNDNQLYDDGADLVGFLDRTYSPVELPDFGIWFDSVRRYVSAEPQLYFRMFANKAFRAQSLSKDSNRPLQHKVMLYFNAPNPKIERIRFDSIPDDGFILEPQTEGRDTVAVWFRVPSASLPDTLRGRITYFKHDSLRILREVTDTLKFPWRLIETKEQEKAREKLERDRRKAEEAGEEFKEPVQPSKFAYKLPLSAEINPEEHLTVDFDYPIEKLDSSVILLTVINPDNKISDVPVHFVRDTASLRRYRIRAPWKTGGQYTLTIPGGAITDFAGYSNDSLVGKYTVADPEKFATVKITVTGTTEGTKYIIQQLDGNGTLRQEKRDVVAGEYIFNYVPAGEIKFRIVEDKNGNGKWDTGNLVERRQPERAEFYTNAEGKTIFATKANWELEVPIDMGAVFAPLTMEALTRLLDEREAQRLQREAERRAKEGPKKKKEDREEMDRVNNSMRNATSGMFNTIAR